MKWITRDKGFYKNLVLLAVPISMQQLVSFLVGFADNVMVSTLGDAAVSGIYLGGQIQFLLQQLVIGLGSALLIPAAQYWGKKDTESIRRLLSFVLRIGTASAFIMALAAFIVPEGILGLFTSDPGALKEGADYLKIMAFGFVFYAVSQILIFAMRSVEAAKIGAIASVTTLAVNVALNYVLIFGKLGISPMGVRGAALATVISRITECAIVIIYVFFKDERLKMTLSALFGGVGGIWRTYLRYGLPVIAGDLVWAVNIMCQGAIIGHYTADVISAASITNTVNNLIYVWLNGLWGGVSIIIGKTIGQGRKETVKEYARTCQIMFLLVGLISGGLIFFGKPWFLMLYQGVSAGARDTANVLLAVLSITIIGTCYEACCLGSLVKAGGDTSFVFKNDAVFVFLVVLPSAYIASRLGAPLWFVFLCLKSDQILKCIVAAVKVNRYKWIKEIAVKSE